MKYRAWIGTIFFGTIVDLRFLTISISFLPSSIAWSLVVTTKALTRRRPSFVSKSLHQLYIPDSIPSNVMMIRSMMSVSMSTSQSTTNDENNNNYHDDDDNHNNKDDVEQTNKQNLPSSTDELQQTIKQYDEHDIERIQRLCCDDPWYQTKGAITHTTIAVADEYIGTTPLLFPGVHSYLGGAQDPQDGCMYGIPSNARTLVCLYPTNNDGSKNDYQVRIIPLPESFASEAPGLFKWLRGIIANGYLYGIPAWANGVLQVDIDALWGRRKSTWTSDMEGNNTEQQFIRIIPLPENHVLGPWQWHGASLNREKTAIYAIPSNSHQVLKVDLIQHTTSLIPIHVPEGKYPNFSLNHSNKWYGGILGEDNAVYGMPYRTCALLRIDTQHDTASLVGPDHGCHSFNWHGGAKNNQFIYAFPSHSNQVLKIDTTPSDQGPTSTLLEIDFHNPDDMDLPYKWLGGCMGADGNIYAMPADASSILKINTQNDHCSTFGYVGMEKNKWQGGVLCPTNDYIYCIPSDATSVLSIPTAATNQSLKTNPIELLGHLPARKNKWQGAYFGNNGILYMIPENGYRILQVQPRTTCQGDLEGQTEKDETENDQDNDNNDDQVKSATITFM